MLIEKIEWNLVSNIFFEIIAENLQLSHQSPRPGGGEKPTAVAKREDLKPQTVPIFIGRRPKQKKSKKSFSPKRASNTQRVSTKPR